MIAQGPYVNALSSLGFSHIVGRKPVVCKTLVPWAVNMLAPTASRLMGQVGVFVDAHGIEHAFRWTEATTEKTSPFADH